MEYSFSHYLLSKQSVDDRALNQHVYQHLQASLPQGPLRIIEVGAGIGSMLIRLLKGGCWDRQSIFWWMKCPKTSPMRLAGYQVGPGRTVCKSSPPRATACV